MNIIKSIILSLALTASCGAFAQSENLFNRGYEDAPVSLTIGYVNKDWVTNFGDGDTYHENLWGETDKRLHGLQLGVGYTPCTKPGLGIQTGLYFEGYISYSDEVKAQYGYDHYEEYDLYVPLHVVWRIPLGRKSSLTPFGGVGINWAMYGKFQDDDYVYDYCDEQFYNVGDYSYQFTYGRDGWPKHFNLQTEVGASLRIDDVLLKASYSRGFTDHKFYWRDGNYKTVQNKLNISIGITY